MYCELSQMASLERNWDSYGAEPPNDNAVQNATQVLDDLMKADILPNAVVPSAEGGVGIVFVRSARYADVEFLNEGEILISTYYGDGVPVVHEVATVEEVVSVIRGYISD